MTPQPGPRSRERHCRRRLVVLGRWPAPGRCKRRLAAGLGAERAARIQRRLSAHTLAVARQLAGRLELEVVLAAADLAPAAARRWGRGYGLERALPQGRGGLGLRLQRQLQRARRERVEHLVLIGSDLPALTTDALAGAFTALRQAAVVLGPACDGGYWLIGLDLGRLADPRLDRRLFSGMPWGSDQVLACTLAAARCSGQEPLLLGSLADLDRPADLAPWR